MGLGESIRLAFEGLKANKMRAVLTMLGIIIGIAAVIGILTVGDGLSGYINSTMSDLGASSIIVTLQEKDREAVSSEDMMSMMVMKQPETTDLMTPEMIAAMQEQFAGRLAATSLSESAGSGKAKDGRLYANVSAMGVNEGYFTVNNVKLSEATGNKRSGRRCSCSCPAEATPSALSAFISMSNRQSRFQPHPIRILQRLCIFRCRRQSSLRARRAGTP